MEEKVKLKLAESLTSDEPGIIPFLPYLLQDFWELGSSPEEMLMILKKHMPITPNTTVLDLACGKGAVSVQLAKEFKIHFTGIDIIPEFIDFAKCKAQEYGVSNLCEFRVEDINLSIETERDYDCVIFGAVGDILGNYKETLMKLLTTIKRGGFLLIDDAYVANHAANSQLQFEKSYLTYDEWCECFHELGLRLIECKSCPDPASDTMDKEMNWITTRANELIITYPNQNLMFEQYIINQQNEYQDLQQDLIGAVWLLQKI